MLRCNFIHQQDENDAKPAEVSLLRFVVLKHIDLPGVMPESLKIFYRIWLGSGFCDLRFALIFFKF